MNTQIKILAATVAALMMSACANPAEELEVVAAKTITGRVSSPSYARSQLTGTLKVQLFEIDERGSITGMPIFETVTDSEGTYSIPMADIIAVPGLDYVVTVTSTSGNFFQEAFVVGENTDVNELTTLVAMAARSAAIAGNTRIDQISVEAYQNLLAMASTWSQTNEISSEMSAYDQMIANADFRAMLVNSFQSTIPTDMLPYVAPQITSFEIRRDGLLVSDTNFAPGQVMSIVVKARDARGLDIQAKFRQIRDCNGYATNQAWSSSMSFSATLTTADISNCASIIVGLKNTDGVQMDTAGYGDIQFSMALTVRDLRQAPILNSVTQYKNGQAFEGTNFKVGDKVDLSVDAYDPRGLNLKYTFYLIRGCQAVATVQTWSASNQMSYTFTQQDITNCTAIIMGIKNDDGINFENMNYGDLQNTQNFSVTR